MSMPSSRRGRGHDRRQHPGLQFLLDSSPLLAGHRAVVRAGDHDLAARMRRPALRDHLRGGGPESSNASPARSPASSLSRAVSRSARRRELANTIVERWASHEIEHPFLDVRPDRRAPLRAGGGAGEVVGRLADRRHVLDRDDDLQVDLSCGSAAGRPSPAGRRRGRSRPPRPVGRWPTARFAAPGARAAHRAVRGTPRDARRAWSRTPRAPRRRSPCRRRAATPRAAEVSSRNSDSGVVIRMSAGRRANSRRSSAGVSPERMATVMSGGGSPSRAAACRMPASGARRLRSTSTASALSGLT